MTKCPKCDEYNVDFDPCFRRPRCDSCGWLPSNFEVRSTDLYKPCDRCWGYHELQYGLCAECDNKGKVLNSLGKEVAVLIKEMTYGKRNW